MAHETRLTYDGDGQPLTVSDALGNTVRLTYDFGNVAIITDPLGRTVQRYATGRGGRSA